MEIQEIRRRKLLALRAEYKTFEALEDKTGVAASYLSQIKNGTRNMGNRVARKIELKIGQQRGWMDRADETSLPQDELALLLQYRQSKESALKEARAKRKKKPTGPEMR
jgi:transcriptional regulator with XRE-family HTH domain